jgi:Protein of unknown function (DUF1329)
MIEMKQISEVIACLVLLLSPIFSFAQTPDALSTQSTGAAASNTIPTGTTITTQNWQQYRQFMPDGMIALFEGKYFWKMPPDVAMEVGPTIIHPLPKPYLDATEKFAGQVKLVELPDGGLTIENYHGGIPFPNPADPHKGWKILGDLWYRYVPHLSVISHATGCLVDQHGSFSCEAAEIVQRQLAYNTDPGVPSTISGTEGKFFTEWLMVLEPEQKRYTATLNVSHADLARPEDQFAFIPALRRYQPISAAARCSPSQGTDATPEELRSGFDSNLTQLQVDFIGEKKLVALLDLKTPGGRFPDGYDMPLGWPTPSWGKWQVRDIYVIAISKLPSQASGYCYGKKVIYVDKQFFAALWEDAYDSNMEPWKYIAYFLRTCEVPGLGPVNSCGADIQAYWDVRNNHATFFTDPDAAHPMYVNEAAPQEYSDIPRYTTAPGLNLIMR